MLAWILLAAVLIVAPVMLRLFAGDNDPRDEPPDPGGEDENRAPVTA